MSQLATPRGNLLGIDDRSPRTPATEQEQLPQLLPLIMLLCEKGKTEPRVVGSAGSTNYFGASTFDEDSPFHTHQTVLATDMLELGGQVMIKRLKPENATTAILRISAEVIATKVPLYQRSSDGRYLTELVTLPDGVSQERRLVTVKDAQDEDVCINGTRIVWHRGVSMYPSGSSLPGEEDERGFAAGAVIPEFRLGSLSPVANMPLGLQDPVDPVEGEYNTSKLYPIFDLEVSSFGEWGNYVGLRLITPTTRTSPAQDVVLSERTRSFIYRVGIMEKSRATGKASLRPNKLGDQFFSGSFKENAKNPATRRPIYIGEEFTESFINDGPNVIPNDGYFDRMHVYQDNLEAILQMVTQGYTDPDINAAIVGEKAYDTQASVYGRNSNLAFTNVNNSHLMNIFTGVDLHGVPYWTLDVRNGSIFGGITFGDETIHYAEGGNDGLSVLSSGEPDVLANLQEFDALFSEQLEFFGELETKFLDYARYPFRTVVDTGFALETKEKFYNVMAARKDTYVVVCPFSQAAPGAPVMTDPGNVELGIPPTFVQGRFAWQEPMSPADELATLSFLQTRASLYIESAAYGTSTVRALFPVQACKKVSASYRRWLPGSLSFMQKIAPYMNSGTRRWRSEFAPDRDPNNIVSGYYKFSNTWLPDEGYDSYWENGAIWVQYKDRTRLFYPAMQSAYRDDTSVLNSAINVAAACELQYIHKLGWSHVTGGVITKGQLIQRVNDFIIKETEGRFDNKVIVEPDTYFTGLDETKGFAYHTDIHMYAANMITVGTLSVIAHRLEDLA